MLKMNKALQLAVMMCVSLCFAGSVRASDVPIAPTGPVYQINNLKWGCAGAGCFNNNFYFSPLNSSGAICVYVYNNNTSSAHPFTAQVKYSGDPSANAPSDATWGAYASPASFTVTSSPSAPAVIGVATSGTALVSVNFSGSTTLSGSPNTANVRIVQTSNGNCMVTGRSNNTGTLSTSASGQATTNPLQLFSDGPGTAYFAPSLNVNPGASTVVASVTNAATDTGKSLYFDSIAVSVDTACRIFINVVYACPGAGCSSQGNAATMRTSGSLPRSVTSEAGSLSASAAPIYEFFMAANTTQVFDLRGVIGAAGTTGGVQVENLTDLSGGGNINVVTKWYEQ